MESWENMIYRLFVTSSTCPHAPDLSRLRLISKTLWQVTTDFHNHTIDHSLVNVFQDVKMDNPVIHLPIH